MRTTANRRAVFGEINITPLTDIFLVLLIIMMVVAPMLNMNGLKLAVPSAGPSSDVTEEPKVTKIKIDASGQFTIDSQVISKTALSAEIKRHKDTSPDGVIIEANPESTHESLTYAMDQVQAAGVTKLAVINASGSSDDTETLEPEQMPGTN